MKKKNVISIRPGGVCKTVVGAIEVDPGPADFDMMLIELANGGMIRVLWDGIRFEVRHEHIRGEAVLICHDAECVKEVIDWIVENSATAAAYERV